MVELSQGGLWRRWTYRISRAGIELIGPAGTFGDPAVSSLRFGQYVMCSPQRIQPFSQVIVSREGRVLIANTRCEAALFFGQEALRSLPDVALVSRCFLGLLHSIT